MPRLPATRRVWQPLIDKALAKHPDDRFQSAEEMLAALDTVSRRMRTVSAGNLARYWKALAGDGHAFGTHTFDHVYLRGVRAGQVTMRPQFGAQAGKDDKPIYLTFDVYDEADFSALGLPEDLFTAGTPEPPEEPEEP